MKTQEIRRADLQKLYTIACEGWQKKIAELALFNSGDEIKVENSLITEAYSVANKEQKKEIEKYFKIVSDDLFNIKTYSEVCNKLGIKELSISDFQIFGNDATRMFNLHKIKNLETLFNENWKPDWKNKSQYKYYPYFEINSSGGLVFVASYSDCSFFYGGVGYYKDSKTSDHIGRYFKDVYENLM
jgi:hypothetical protein